MNPKPIKDVTNSDAQHLLFMAMKQALKDELHPLIFQLKRIADALEGKKP